MTFGRKPARLFAVVLAGGSGRRLERLTRRYERAGTPKQFCAFGGPRTLLQMTLDRLAPLVAVRDTVVVVDASHELQAARQIRNGEGPTILPQACDRGTAAGVLLPVSHIVRRHPDALILITPSDHAVADETVFARGIEEARGAVESGAAEVVVFGVESREPSTDFGWITPGAPLARCSLRRVSAFVEKPALERARELCGVDALWNTMVVLARGRALLDLFRHTLPGLSAVFDSTLRLTEHGRAAFLNLCYERLPRTDFSRDVLEAADGLAVCCWPRALGWTDLGTPERMQAWLPGRRTPPAELVGKE